MVKWKYYQALLSIPLQNNKLDLALLWIEVEQDLVDFIQVAVLYTQHAQRSVSLCEKNEQSFKILRHCLKRIEEYID